MEQNIQSYEQQLELPFETFDQGLSNQSFFYATRQPVEQSRKLPAAYTETIMRSMLGVE